MSCDYMKYNVGDLVIRSASSKRIILQSSSGGGALFIESDNSISITGTLNVKNGGYGFFIS